MTRIHLIALIAFATLGACESDPLSSTNPFQAYDQDKVTVIGGDVTVPVATGDLTTDNCLQVTAETCIAVAREGTYCKNSEGPADAVLVNGMVAQVVCYAEDPRKGTTTVVDTDSDGDIDVPQNGNGAVIVFDPATDGKPIAGNVTIDGNDVTLYGNGPDKSIINGNLIITGNNARIRGVWVKGNVEINLNTAALLLSVVEGDLTVGANNALVAETAVFGDFTVSGNNSILVGDGTAGTWGITGRGASCERNYKITDANTNNIVDEGDRGTTLTCP